MPNDVEIIRDLAKRYAEIASKEVQDERRDLWRKHNSFVRTRPLVYAREFLSTPELIAPQLRCEDPFWRGHERMLCYWIQHDTFDDDYIIEPWITQQATFTVERDRLWGVEVKRIPSPDPRGAWMFDPPIKELTDVDRLVMPHHVIDKEATAHNADRLRDAVGEIIAVRVARAPIYMPNLAQHLADLRGLEQSMWDMLDHPEWLHDLLAFLRDGVLAVQEEAEQAGDWHLSDGSNQAMTYAQELPDPQADGPSVTRDQLWGYFDAQEFTLVSPSMHDEFMLQYQLPIMKKSGLTAYGCCEDLTNKIDMLRKVPNLRRISVTPFADVTKCAEQIGQDYIIGWRPSPAEMVSSTFDPDHIRKVVREAAEAMRGCYFDVCLKDVVTVRGQPERIRDWARITRETLAKYV